MKRTTSSTLLVPLCLAAAVVGVQAQDSETLDPTVVYGGETPDASSLFELEPITALDIEEVNATNLEEIFRLTPAVTVNGGRNQAQQIFVNNIESPLLNVTVDGASQANLFHHQSQVMVDPELLQVVEVVAGAGSALDGPGALGGAIRFETKDAFDLLQTRPVYIESGKEVITEEEYVPFGATLKSDWFSNGEGYRTGATAYGLLSDNVGCLLSGSYTDRDSYIDGNGNEVENTDYTRKSGLVKLSGRFDNGHSFDLSYENFLDETLAFDRVNIDPLFLFGLGRTPGPLQKLSINRQSVNLSYDINPWESDFWDLETTTYYNHQEFERSISGEAVEVGTVGFDIRNTSRAGEWLEATYGVDYKSIDSKSSYLFATPGAGEDERVLGLYLQPTVYVGDIAELTFGARFDDYDYNDVNGQNFASNALSPNATLTVKPLEHLALSAGYAESYRGVGIREAFLPFSVPAGLDGEEADTLKAGLTYDNQTFFLSGSVFDQSIDNYIFPVSRLGSFGDIENQGYEVSTGIRQGGLTFSLGMAYAEPETVGYEYPDDLGMVVTGRQWVADLSYNFEQLGLKVGWTAEIREEVDEVPLPGGGPFAAVAGKDDYVLHNIYADWMVPNVDGLSLHLNVDNLFDEFYQDHTIFNPSGLASPGREFRVGVRYEF